MENPWRWCLPANKLWQWDPGILLLCPVLGAPLFAREQRDLKESLQLLTRRERNVLGVARGALLPSGSIWQSAAELSLVLGRTLGELGLVGVWEIILGLHNLIWPQEVKILAFLGLPLHRNDFDNETRFRSFLLTPASPCVSWLDNYSCLSGCGKLGHWADLS